MSTKVLEIARRATSQEAVSEDGETVFKAHSFGGRHLVQVGGAEHHHTVSAKTSVHGYLEPPYDPGMLLWLVEISNALPQNIDAYVTNIDSFGHRLIARIDLSADDASSQVAQALWLDRAASTLGDPLDEPEPTPEEVETLTLRLSRAQLLERQRIERFFENCCSDITFVELRRRTRKDLESTGNAWWEVLRDRRQRVARFSLVPSASMRLFPIDPELVPVREFEQVSPLRSQAITVQRRFRRHTQIDGTTGSPRTFFKTFRDPRIIGARTGKVYANQAELEAADPSEVAANEVVHFKVFSVRSPYGIARWIGNQLSVRGSHEMEQVNSAYFSTKTVPPLIMTVSGGARMTEASITRIENFVRENIQGRENFWKILILQAETGPLAEGSAHTPHIEVKPMTSATPDDATHQAYDEANRNKVGESFRNSPIVRGQSKDFNRACYDERTQTLTETGWKSIDKFTLGERVAAYDTLNDRIEWVKPDALHVYEVDEELLHFQSSVVDIMVTEDHTMLVRNLRSGNFESYKAQDIPWDRYCLKTVACFSGGENPSYFELPKVENCKIERGHTHVMSVKMFHFVEFLGYWISEGSLLCTEHPSAPYIVTASQKSGDVADKMRACFAALRWGVSESVNERDGMSRWTWSNRCLRDWLARECGTGCADKRLPRFARTLCQELSRVLFDALMDGDGHWDPRPNRTSGYYSSTSRALADDVQALAIRLGYRAALSLHYGATGNRRACWRVTIAQGRDAELRSEPRRVHYQGRVYCFSVPSHGFFVTRRNGKVAIQGNTADAALRFGEDQVYSPEREGFDGWTNKDLMTELGARHLIFQSQTRAPRDPERQAKLASDFVRAGVFTPEDARRVAEDVFNITLPRITEDWVKRPIPLTLAGVQTSQVAPDQVTAAAREQKRSLLSAAGVSAAEIESVLAATDDVVSQYLAHQALADL